MTDLLPVDDAVDALGDIPNDDHTSSAIAALSFSQVAGIVRALDRRVALIAGRWLIEQRRRHTDGSWSEALDGYAESFERSTSTLRRWIAAAAEHFGILHELPAQGSATRGAARRGETPPAVDDARPPQLRLFEPETVEDVRQLGAVVTKVGADRLAEAMAVAEIEALIGVLRAARTAALRRAALEVTGGSDHEHRWAKKQASFGGFVWHCQHPGCTETHLTKPESA